MFNDGDTLLYVINHAYARGGERIEVFKLIEHFSLKLDYQFSIVFD